MRLLLSIAFLLFGFLSNAQFVVKGKITDANQNPLAGAHIKLGDKYSFSDANGDYIFSGLTSSEYTIFVSYVGYASFSDSFRLDGNKHMDVILKEDRLSIEEVQINTITKTIENKQNITDDYIRDNFSGSLVQSLQNVAGINVMSIGSGAGKPIVRGLGFNRVVVSLNSSKHEGQQWGADHGLETDAFSAESVELIKGTAAIRYGSDAIGGVLNIKNNLIPEKNSFTGKATLLARSVNNTIGGAFEVKQREDKFFYKFKTSYLDFGDFNTPTDTIVYLTRKIPIHNRRLKNTAGQEWSAFGQIGYVRDNYHSILTISNNQTKAGFFPGSHGIPDLNRLQDDGDSRNIEYPYQRANHFMIQNLHKWSFTGSELELNLAFQNNHRQEKSQFHTHYSNQLPPEKDADTELDFSLNTFGSTIEYSRFFSGKHKTDLGMQLQFQDNRIKGYNFLLPEYKRENFGLFAMHNYHHSDKLRFDLGIRYDFFAITTREFYDQTLFQYLIGRNYPEEVAGGYAQRSSGLSKNFSNFNAKAGLLYSLNNNIDLAFNMGSSFRTPTAIELEANGIHHGSFRHEKGDQNLEAERGYVADFQVIYKKDNFSLDFSPYLYYFTNYIYLRPTGEFSVLPHSGQIYQFSQTKAMLSGFELESGFSFDKFSAEVVLEYIYNKQLGNNSQNYPLPFTPPFNAFAKVNYSFLEQSTLFENTIAFVSGKYFAGQDRIAQNEAITPSSIVFGMGFSTSIKIGYIKSIVSITGNNLFNIKYFNHISFYRALEIPEQGRNIQMMIQIPF